MVLNTVARMLCRISKYMHVSHTTTLVISLVASETFDEIQDTAACPLMFNSSHCHEPEYVPDILIHRTIHD